MLHGGEGRGVWCEEGMCKMVERRVGCNMVGRRVGVTWWGGG